jgi:hypothetical protein
VAFETGKLTSTQNKVNRRLDKLEDELLAERARAEARERAKSNPQNQKEVEEQFPAFRGRR